MKSFKMLVIAMILIVFTLHVYSKDIRTFDFLEIFKQNYKLSENWVENKKVGNQILKEEQINSFISTTWINKTDNSQIIIMSKDTDGFYPPKYFQDREQIKRLAKRYNLIEFNVSDDAFLNKCGVNMGFIEFKKIPDSKICSPFCIGTWTIIPIALKAKDNFKYFNNMTIIFYRSFTKNQIPDSYKEFKFWRNNLELRYNKFVEIDPKITKYMRDLLKEYQVNKIGVSKAQKEVLETKQNVGDKIEPNVNLSEFAKWFAPIDVLQIEKYYDYNDLKNIKHVGKLKYDFNSNSFILNFGQQDMPLEFKNIARFEIVSIKKLFKKSKYSLKLIPLNSSKLNRIIYFEGLSKLGGYKFLREYLNNIRKINSILYGRSIDLL